MAVGQPRFFGWPLAAAEALLDGPVQVAVVGEQPGRRPADRRWRGASGRRARWWCRASRTSRGVPLLADRPLIGGAAAAYVCRGMVCDLPVTEVEDLVAQLAR